MQYDSYGRASGSTYILGSVSQSYGITYEDITGLVEKYTTPQNSFTYSYDEFDRLKYKTGNRHGISYTYVAAKQQLRRRAKFARKVGRCSFRREEEKWLADGI